jgi:hypothetical protein
MRICECFIHAFSHCPVAPPAMLYRRGWGRTSHLSAPAAGERQIRRRRCVALSRVHVRDAALLWRRPWLVIGPHPCARGFGSQAKVQWHQGKSFVSTLSLHRAASRMGEAPNQSVGLPIFHACEAMQTKPFAWYHSAPRWQSGPIPIRAVLGYEVDPGYRHGSFSISVAYLKSIYLTCNERSGKSLLLPRL